MLDRTVLYSVSDDLMLDRIVLFLDNKAPISHAFRLFLTIDGVNPSCELAWLQLGTQSTPGVG